MFANFFLVHVPFSLSVNFFFIIVNKKKMLSFVWIISICLIVTLFAVIIYASVSIYRFKSDVILLNKRLQQIDSFLQPHVALHQSSQIPKIIHQTWKYTYLPVQYTRWSAAIRAMHPDWEYKLWSDTMNRSFIKEHYSWFLPIYDGYDVNIKRVDAIRYFLLFHFGGVYMDMDFVTLKPLDDLIKTDQAIFGYQHQLHNQHADGAIANAFMATPPGHSLFKDLLLHLDASKHKSVIYATGPIYLTNMIRIYPKQKKLLLLPMPLIYTNEWNDNSSSNLIQCQKHVDRCADLFPDSYTATFWTGSWVNNHAPMVYSLLTDVPARRESQYKQLIPKQIIQIYITDLNNKLVPDSVFDAMHSWIELNPEYTYTTLDNASCIDLLSTHFEPGVLQAYLMLKPFCYKCDLARLCWLYVHGGVYCDLRTILKVPLRKIIKTHINFFIPKDRLVSKNCKIPLLPGFIGSVSKHPFLKQTINMIVENVHNQYYGDCALDPTGPSVIGNAVGTVVNNLITIEPGVFKQNDYYYEILDLEYPYVKQNDKVIMMLLINKGNEFTSYIKNGNSYGQMWENNDIYNLKLYTKKDVVKKQNFYGKVIKITPMSI